MRNQKGITLIALVITIIVLLILAGVSIAMLTGQNGILTQANSSKYETSRAAAIEKINLALNAVKAKIYEKQVSSSTYSPLDASNTADHGLQADIADLLELDQVGTFSTSSVNDTYTWNLVTESTVTYLVISYKSDINHVSELSGKIVLSAAPYTITAAPQS